MSDEAKVKLSGQQVLDAGLEDWRQLLQALQARFRAPDFATVLALATRVGEVAEEMNHHPDLDLRWGVLDVKLSSHDVGGLTVRDVRLARRISELAREVGAEPRPREVVAVEIALDTPDAERVAPFWWAVLGLGGDGHDEVVDPVGAVPTLWFQDTDPHEEPRQRFHYDVWVPHDVAVERIAAALEAGGTMVSDDEAPSFWVLADADGNKACICTWQERG